MSAFVAQTRLILRNDLRLLWRDLLASRFRSIGNVSLLVTLFVIANAISIAVFFGIGRQAPLAGETFVWLFFAFLILGTAMNQAISVLFERADFDLLLTAPISPRAILVARLAAISVGAALSVAILLLPLLNGAILALSWHYLAGYVVWLLLSCAVASVGVWITLLLVQWLGPRRARTWSQVIASVLGASIYLLIQGHNLLPADLRSEASGYAVRIVTHPALAFIGRAGRGEPVPLLTLAALTGIFATLTTRLLAKLFIGGVQAAGGISPATRRKSTSRYVFAEGVFYATFRKDVRLILRDPLLLAQVLPTGFYVLPLLFGFSRFSGSGLLAPIALMLCAQFSYLLSLVSAGGEECWDLIRMSPTAELRLRVAKMAAAVALPVLLCIALVALGRPWLALLTLVFSIGCGAACAWLQVAQITPTPRRDIIKRRQTSGGMGRGFITVIIMLLGGGGLGAAATGHGILASVLLGVSTLAIIACFTLVEVRAISVQEFSSADAAVGGAKG